METKDFMAIREALVEIRQTLIHQSKAITDLVSSLNSGRERHDRMLAANSEEIDALQMKVAAADASYRTMKKIISGIVGVIVLAASSFYWQIQGDHDEIVKLRTEFDYFRHLNQRQHQPGRHEGETRSSWAKLEDLGITLGK